jgi:hypothetical protein
MMATKAVNENTAYFNDRVCFHPKLLFISPILVTRVFAMIDFIRDFLYLLNVKANIVFP